MERSLSVVVNAARSDIPAQKLDPEALRVFLGNDRGHVGVAIGFGDQNRKVVKREG